MGQTAGSLPLKRFVNHPREVVNDALEGYLWTHPNVQLLDGYPEATCDGVVRTEHACWLCLLALAPTGCPNL
ncbi:unnamed protein product [Cladocopium goreaui]|uniref:Dihydroxyacetone kinase n=1 Tax=Cladocopium goreaui TaxID=2562237 RepID=A0A9P1CLY4_9DINO|nr:unnamed protein product [Cladocopium goreaui]